ncbi:MAG: YigZ family protein [Anaerolineales bacterium]
MSRNYVVPLTEIRREQTVVNSRFIATLAPAFSIDEARAFMKRIREEFADASHNVPVYIIGGGNTVTEYFSDDGEPSGTSGKPALTVLRGSGLGDAVLVVTRYFGGTLLGTGGLVKAYTEAAQSVVNVVERGRRVPVCVVMVAIPYNLLERVRLLATKNSGNILGEDYAADITLTLRFPVEYYDNFQTDLRELTAGKIQAEVIETKEEIIRVDK